MADSEKNVQSSEEGKTNTDVDSNLDNKSSTNGDRVETTEGREELVPDGTDKDNDQDQSKSTSPPTRTNGKDESSRCTSPSSELNSTSNKKDDKSLKNSACKSKARTKSKNDPGSINQQARKEKGSQQCPTSTQKSKSTTKQSRSRRTSGEKPDKQYLGVEKELQRPASVGCDDSVSVYLDNEDFLSDSTAMMAAQMGQDTFGYMGAPAPYPGMIPQQRSRIIQDILRNFDLEEVMSRYRGRTVYNGCSESAKTLLFQDWLEEIMGEDWSYFDDYKWNQRLREKVTADLEKRFDENERMLEEAENQRVLKLKIHGLYPEDEEEAERRRSKHKSHKKTKAEKEFDRRNQTARDSLFRPSGNIEDLLEGRTTPRDGSTGNMDDDSDNSDDDVNNEDRDNSGNSVNNENRDDDPTDRNDDTDNTENIDNHDSHQSEVDTPETSTSESRKVQAHPRLKKLFHEEDLQQLYKEAETLVYVSNKTESNKKPKK